MVAFYLDSKSGVPTYLQLVQQVVAAVQLGYLSGGDQLPTVKEVVSQLAINPNTVLKAYRELEHQGVAAGRPGLGTFILETVAVPTLSAHPTLRRSLERWLGNARAAGLDDESINALFTTALRAVGVEGAA